MKPCILCRYSEIALKGKNRFVFEDRLIANIRDCLRRNSVIADVRKIRGRIIIYTEDHGAYKFVKDVFGLSSLSPAFEIASDFDTILAISDEYTSSHLPKGAKTFRISTNRADKSFPMNSNIVDDKVGYSVGEKYDLKADLKSPDYNLHIEIHKETFIYHEKIACHGGLPVGVSGNIARDTDRKAAMTGNL
ncbi:TPA: tRNA 4-thiouridine(8) synthase ThiI, partial [Candidatus Woesearchaeota archaeon]|nr:tRNA 4-thiouridine(8) synthase ThiI [Candidatus Woesearchaeota archaeon]